MSKSVVITGAGRGIGRATARVLTAERWSVVGVEIDDRVAAIGEADVAEMVIGDVCDYAVLEEFVGILTQGGDSPQIEGDSECMPT